MKSNSAEIKVEFRTWNFEKKVTKMKILVMMCLASAIASVTQSDPQPKGKLELKIQKTFNFLRKLLYTRK